MSDTFRSINAHLYTGVCVCVCFCWDVASCQHSGIPMQDRHTHTHTHTHKQEIQKQITTNRSLERGSKQSLWFGFSLALRHISFQMSKHCALGDWKKRRERNREREVKRESEKERKKTNTDFQASRHYMQASWSSMPRLKFPMLIWTLHKCL